jgi:hypothetical protein
MITIYCGDSNEDSAAVSNKLQEVLKLAASTCGENRTYIEADLYTN